MKGHYGNEHRKACEFCHIEQNLSAKLYAFMRTDTKKQGYAKQQKTKMINGKRWNNKKWSEIYKQ